MKDLKQRVIRGGFAKICSQGAGFVVRMGSLMILARLLDPKDFGLVGMVTAVIGVFNLFRDFGLSAAAVQRNTTVTREQASTLFWVNILVGAILGLLSFAIAPFAVLFYHETRLFGITAALASGFLFNAAGVQHSAMLEREMRFTTLSVIDTISLLTSVLVGIGMALHGYGYWALVATTTVAPLVYTVCVWLTTAWVPGRPHRRVGVRSMMRFGGTLTLNGLVMYIATNFEKVLLGRFWGAEAIGVYGRAYQLVNMPNDNLNSAASGVAFAALSRLQDDPPRFRSYFLKGYALVLSLTVPVTVACALFAKDMISVFLGPKWQSAVTVVSRLRAHHDCGLPNWLALWTQGCCVCLLSDDDLVRHSDDRGCRTRYCDFRSRCSADCEPAIAFRHRDCRACAWTAVLVQPISFATAQARARSCSGACRVPRDALVRDGTEAVLPGYSPRIQKATVSRRAAGSSRLAS